MRRRCATVALVWAALLALAPGAGASTVVVGSPLNYEFKTGVNFSGLFATITNNTLDEAGAHVTSPVTGTVVRWRTKGKFSGGPFRLRVLRPAAAGSFIGAGASSFQTVTGPALQVFTTQLPIKAGDLIGLDAEKEAGGFPMEALSGPHALLWSPLFPEGGSSPAVAPLEGEVGFDAEVVPTPTVILVGPSSGPLTGGTSVTIAGRDLEGATAVKFGPNAASANFTVDSDNEITAVAPPGAQPGSVDVTVTTPGGTSATAAGDLFTYAATPVPPVSCTVPALAGKTLKSARKKLAKAHCALGKVTKKKGVTARTGKVVKQSPKPGTVLASGAEVKVTLGGG